MSGNGPVYPGLIPDIDFGMKLMSGIGPVMSGIWPVMSGIGPVMSGILPGMSVTGPVMYGIWPKILVMFWTSHIDVRTMARKSWP